MRQINIKYIHTTFESITHRNKKGSMGNTHYIWVNLNGTESLKQILCHLKKKELQPGSFISITPDLDCLSALELKGKL